MGNAAKNKKNKMKNFFTNFWPIIFIFLVWFIFSSPYFLKGKAPFSGTYLVNNFAPWSAYPEFWGPVKNGAMPDVITQILPWKKFTIDTFKAGQIPLWNPYSFSGTPHLANYQSAVLSPFNLLFFFLPFADALSLLILFQPLLAGIFMFIFVRSLKASKTASLISSISFMFCGFITVWMGYGTLAYAILFLPLSLFAIEKFYEKQSFIFLLLLSLSIALSFFSGHFQISLYFFITIVVYLLYKYFAVKNLKLTIATFLYLFLGLMLALPQLLPSIEFYLQSLRSTIFQKGEVIPFQYIPTLLAHDFLGNPVTRNDWFGHYAEWNGYIGVLPLILAIHAVISKKRVQTLFLFIFAIFIILLAFDTPLLSLLIGFHIPVLSTSAASRIIVVYSFLFAVLSAFGFDELMTNLKEKRFNQIYLLLSLFFIIFLILWGIVVFKLFIPQDRLIVARQNLIFPTVLFISSSLILLGFTLFPKLFTRMTKEKLIVLGLLFVLIVAFDMLRFAKKWMPFDPGNLVFPNVATTSKFTKLSGHERVLGNLGAEALVSYKMPSIEGYDSLYIKRYGELIASIDDGNIKESPTSAVIFPRDVKYTEKSFNLLGIKYLIHKKSDDNMSWTFPYWNYPDETFSLIYEDDRYKIFRNNNAYPRAFLVSNYKVVSNPQKIIDTMFSENFDLRKEIVLEKDPKIKLKKTSGNVDILKYSPNEIDIRANSSTDSLLFISDNFYPGWIARVDGKNTQIFRANYTFRAILLPKGEHMVKFIYEPESFRNGIYLSLAGGFLILFISNEVKKRILRG